MKRVTASEARRSWFRLLDEVASGAVVVIERAGRRIVIQRQEEEGGEESTPDYDALIRVDSPESAAEWSWEWSGPEGELSLSEESSRPGDEEE